MDFKSFVILFVISTCSLRLGGTATTSRSEKTKPLPVAVEQNKDNSKTDDRINLNVNHGHAFAHGPLGFSGSDVNTYGIQAGIRGPGGSYYSPLFSRTGGQGSSYSTGPGSPNTWANGHTQLGNGYIGGDVGAGFNGGDGFANVDSFTQQIEIPIDPYGTTLLYNLKKPGTKSKQPTGTGTKNKGTAQ